MISGGSVPVYRLPYSSVLVVRRSLCACFLHTIHLLETRARAQHRRGGHRRAHIHSHTVCGSMCFLLHALYDTADLVRLHAHTHYKHAHTHSQTHIHTITHTSIYPPTEAAAGGRGLVGGVLVRNAGKPPRGARCNSWV